MQRCDLLVIATERFSVHVEQEVSGGVGTGCDDDILGRCRVRSGWEREVWGGLTEIILHCTALAKTNYAHQVERPYIAALAIIIGCLGRGGLRVGVCILVVDGGQSIRLICKVAIRAKV